MTSQKEKASGRAERLLIQGILDGTYSPGSDLPGERDLCRVLEVARPVLREALQGLSRDGWLTIQQGKPTRVNDFMHMGNLNVLVSLLQADISFLPNFVSDLLELWALLAPAYTRAAIEREPRSVYDLLWGFRGLADHPRSYVRAQWRLHRALIDSCGNPIYGLILNSFADFYERLSWHYYEDAVNRADTRELWETLATAALASDGEAGRLAMTEFMAGVRVRWAQLDFDALIGDDADETDQMEGSEREGAG